MEKEDTNLNHSVQINDRKNALITGIKKLESFDNKEFFINSVMGYMLIKGESLELLKLDTYNGTISIKGVINSINYLEDTNKKITKESILSKLFKWL